MFFNLFKNRDKELKVLNEVFEGSRAARLITDSTGKTVFINYKYTMLTGVDKERATLKSLESVFEDDPESFAKFRLLVENAERGNSDTIVLPVRARDERRWYQITAQPVASWAGYVHWRIDDITDRYTVEAFIREEREKLMRFTDNAPVGFFSVNEEGRFLFVNPTLAQWLETDVQTLLTKHSLHDFIVTPPSNARPYDVEKKGKAKQAVEIMMKGVKGREFLASVNQSVIEEGHGKVRTNAVVHDLTSERQMVKALEDSQHRFQRFFEEAPLGVVFLNEQGKIEDCNSTFAALVKVQAKELAGKTLTDVIAEEDRLGLSQAIKSLADGGGLKSGLEITLKYKDATCPVEMHARRFRESESTVLHFIDMSEKKSLEQQFAQSQKMQAIGQLAGGVAHDFNNLLTAMIGFCDLLLLRHKPGDPSFSDVSQIKQNANRAANLVRQLLAFSRQQTLRPQVLDVTDTLTELSHLLRRLLGANIELDVIHESNLGHIKVDEGQLEQVLINLAVNARDAMIEKGGNGTLTISTANFENKQPLEVGTETMPVGQWVKVSVTDTGSGMAPDIIERIFEPFFTTKGVGSGTGLGLATVYGIIRQTGGYIGVDSVLGDGTTFTLYFPQHKAGKGEISKVKKEEVNENQDLTGTATIMLVEDEDAVRTFSARALSNKGYEVLEANCAETALMILEEKNPKLDLLITDVIMPGMDGGALAKKVLETRPDLKIVFVSGYTDDKLKEDMGGDVHFLPKPFTLQQLAAKVKEVLE